MGMIAEERHRIFLATSASNLEVQMWCGRIAGRADRANDLLVLNLLAATDIDARQMSIERAQVPSVIDSDRETIA